MLAVLIALSTPCIILAVGAANRSPKEVDLSVHLGNDISTSCPVNNDAEGFLAHSEIPTVPASDTRSVEEKPVIPVVPQHNVSAVRISNASSSYPSPELTVAQDPLTCVDTGSYKIGVSHIDTRCVEIEVNAIVLYVICLNKSLSRRKYLVASLWFLSGRRGHALLGNLR